MDSITAKTLLLVEGKDDLSIASLLLQKMDADYATKIDIQSKDGGRDLLKAAKAIATVSGFDRLISFAVLVDAEEDAAKTQTTWTAFQAQFHVDHPSVAFEFLVLPSSHEAGALDSVFLRSLDIAENNVARCAIDFSNCVNGQGKITTVARKDKLALMSYINAHSTNPYSRVAKALEQQASGLFDFNHVGFKPLTEFLSKLL
jgi:hypothetical protein